MAVDESKFVELARLFAPHATLFAVGGYVREKLLNLPCHDLDICSQMRVEDVKMILSNTDFVVMEKNMRLGTVLIKSDNFVAQYTAFRTDSYDSGGCHTPAEVKFTTDIREDAKRRDFACNAIYFNPLRAEFVDLCGGIEDTLAHTLRCVVSPKIVFGADGLRILRMVRQACELGFQIEEETFWAAKENVDALKDITQMRVLEELQKILLADVRFDMPFSKGAHARGVKLLDELGALELLLPELNLDSQDKRREFERALACLEFAPPILPLRWALLLRIAGSELDDESCAGVCAQICDRLLLAKAVKRRTVDIVRNQSLDREENLTKSQIARVICRLGEQSVQDIIHLKRAQLRAEGREDDINLQVALSALKDEGVPLKIGELCVGGEELVAMGIPEKDRADVLWQLLMDSIDNAELRNRDVALQYLRKRGER